MVSAIGALIDASGLGPTVRDPRRWLGVAALEDAVAQDFAVFDRSPSRVTRHRHLSPE